MTIRATLPPSGKGTTRLYAIEGDGYPVLIGKIRGEVTKIQTTLTAPYEWYISIDTTPHTMALWVNEIQKGDNE